MIRAERKGVHAARKRHAGSGALLVARVVGWVRRDRAWIVVVRTAGNDPAGPAQVERQVPNKAAVKPQLDYLAGRIRVAHADPEETLRQYIHEVRRTRRVTAGDEARLRRAIEHGQEAAEDARHQLVQAHLEDAMLIAQSYWAPGRSLKVLIQEANLGLLRAAEAFDWRAPEGFSTQAGPWIHEAIADSL